MDEPQAPVPLQLAADELETVLLGLEALYEWGELEHRRRTLDLAERLADKYPAARTSEWPRQGGNKQ